MNPLIVVLLIGSVSAVCGGGCGWWACRMLQARRGRQADASRTREALDRLNRLAGQVISDVRAHKRQLAHLSAELAGLDGDAPPALARFALGLAASHQELEQQLLSAESLLEEHAQEFSTTPDETCTDGLTGLANRRGFHEELVRRFEESGRLQRPLSVIILDLDQFEAFHDQQGRPMGEEVLRGIAGALRHTVRGMDLVARCGGEEFGVVLPNTPLIVATAVAERIRDAIAALEFPGEGGSHGVTVSSGVAELRAQEPVAELLRRAGDALMASKQQGRNCTHFHNGLEVLASGASSDGAGRGERGRRAEAAISVNSPLAIPAPLTERSARAPATGSRDPGTPAERDALIADRSALLHMMRSRLAEWKRGGKPFVALMVGVQGVPETRARLGSATAERMIWTVSRQLASAVREMDTIGRLEDHRFAVLLPGMTRATAAQVTRRIHQHVAECSVVHQGSRIPIRITIGVAEAAEGDDGPRLLERAHSAMLAAGELEGANVAPEEGDRPSRLDDLVTT